MYTKPPQKEIPRFFRVAQLVGILGVSLLVLNFIYQMWHLHEKNSEASSLQICKLQFGSCTKQLPNNTSLTVSITPTPIETDQKSTITVSLTGLKPDHVGVLLFSYPVTGPPAKPMMLSLQPNGIYLGHFAIKQASNGVRKWVALVILQTGSQEIAAPFQFEMD